MTRRQAKILVRSVGLLLLGLAVWAFVIEPASLRVQSYTVTIPDWPVGLSGLRIAVLADLHTGSPFNDLGKLRAIVTATNGAGCDLILLAGDLVIQGVLGGTVVPPEDSAGILKELSAPLGVYAVLGNHDWWLNADRVRRALEGVQIPVLEDDAVEITGKQGTFWLAGISDFWEGAHDVSRALSKVPAAGPVLTFTHNPDVFPEIPSRVSLTIAGHTHGGQVHVPIIGRPVVPSRYGERFAAGHIVEEVRHLFVSTGLGTSILPVRFRVPPEISILTVRSVAGTDGAS